MAGTIIADTIQATSQQISLNVGNTTILTASSTGLTLIPTTNVNINVTNSTATFGGGNVSRPSISFSGNTSTGLYMPLANTIAWSVAGSEAMRFDSSGNLGIGTNSPSYRLDVVGAGSPANGIVRASSHLNNNSTKYGYYTVGHYTNSVAPFGFIQGESNATENNVHIGSGAGETTAATRIDFYTASNNTTTGGTERMRIDSSGDVMIGGTTSTATARLNVYQADSSQRVVHFENTRNVSTDENLRLQLGSNCNNTASYSLISTTGGADKFYLYGNGTYGTVSDRILKKNIETARTGYIEDLCKLRVVKYNWATDAEETPKEIGWIAQEVAEVFPGMVQDSKPNDDGDVHKQVKTSVLPFMLLKAMQEQQEIINEMKARLDAQAVEIAALKAK